MSLTDKVDAIFKRWDNADSPGCALGIIHDGELIYSHGYGSAHLEHDIPITPKTIFHVASISKQLTAYLIIQLAHNGKISLDDDVRKYVPELPAYDSPIRIHHLIHHTSGLRNHWSLFYLAGWRPDDVKTTDDALDLAIRQRQLNSPPGEQHLYCNTGYALLRIIIERITGLSLRQYAHQGIFAPLEMRDTHFHDDHNEVVKNRAVGYQQCTDRTYKISVPVYDTVGETGLFTNIEDFTKWARFLESARINGDPVVATMLSTGFLNNGQQVEYGGGLFLNHYCGLPTIQHGGNDAGYRSDFLWFPNQRFAFVIFGNVDSLAPLNEYSSQVADLYLEQLGIPLSPRDAVTPASDNGTIRNSYQPASAEINEYVGCYYSDELRAHHDVRLVDGALRFRLYRAQDDLECRFDAPDSVVLDEYLTGKFTRDDAGRIDKLLLSSFGAHNIECIKLPTAAPASSEPGRHDIKVPALSEPCQKATVSG